MTTTMHMTQTVFTETGVCDSRTSGILRIPPQNPPKTYTYTGREYDAETGLYYYRARYYSTDLGRFLQRDPAGPDKLKNLYTYVQNNPVNYFDPSGCKIEISDWPPGFRDKINDFLYYILFDDNFARVWWDLYYSVNVHKIEYSFFNQTSVHSPYAGETGIGSNTTIYINPDSDTDETFPSWKRDPDVGFFHELVTAWFADKGELYSELAVEEGNSFHKFQIDIWDLTNAYANQYGEPRRYLGGFRLPQRVTDDEYLEQGPQLRK